MILSYIIHLILFLGRGFDQETFSEKDEGAVCSYNTHTKGNARKDGIWDIFHPNVFNPRGNAGVVLLGEFSCHWKLLLYRVALHFRLGVTTNWALLQPLLINRKMSITQTTSINNNIHNKINELLNWLLFCSRDWIDLFVKHVLSKTRNIHIFVRYTVPRQTLKRPMNTKYSSQNHGYVIQSGITLYF